MPNQTPKRQIRFNAFQMNTVGHQAPGLWTHPRDTSSLYRSTAHWVELARLLEDGRFDAIFLADVLGAYDVYGGNIDAAIRNAVQVLLADPLALVPLMAHATRHLGFGVTAALTYEHPYTFARRMSTLDHLTDGRVGWNIVTGYLDSAARNLGLDRQLGHDARYDLADEYLEVVYKLWERSWSDEAVLRDKASGVYADPAQVRAIHHKGQHYSVPGIHLCEPSPQRTPFLYQAGTSPRGLAFAARHAEATFVCGPSQKVTKRFVDETRSAVRAAGREADEVLVYAQALIVTAPTEAEAQAKYQDYLDHVSVDGALAMLSGWTGVDFSKVPLDATVEYIDTDAGRSALASLSSADPERRWTVREAARFVGLGGRGPVLVGDPRQIADQLEAWQDNTGADGFNLAFALAHESMRDVVELVVPELQRRGRYRKEYTGGTLRHQAHGRGDRLPPHHPGQQVRVKD
jgi:FMN-dependent oxidoreductase (nitrilotriacetate monooxygenase family)